MRRFFFIVEWGFTKRDFERFSCQYLISQNIQFTVVDVSRYVHQKPDTSAYSPIPSIEGYDVLTVSNDLELENFIKSFNEEDWYKVLVSKKLKSYKILDKLSNSPAKRVVLDLFNTFPSESSSFRSKLLSVFRNPQKAVNHLTFVFKTKIFDKLFSIPYPQTIMTAGRIPKARMRNSFPRAKIISCHCMDFDTAIAHSPLLKNLPQKYIVFLDENLPFHPDYHLLGVAPPATAEEYFTMTKMTLSRLSATTTLPVIIAAHPSASYLMHDRTWCWEGYEVISGSTVELVRNASLVALHASTALNFAAIFKKPMVFLNTKKFKNQTILSQNISTFSELFGALQIDMDAVCNKTLFSIPNIADNKFHSYIEAIVKDSDAVDMTNAEILAAIINGKPIKTLI